MLFSVLISVDAPAGTTLVRHLRTSIRRALRGSVSESEYRYLANESDDPDHSPWKWALEWKGAGILTRPQFDALIDDLGLVVEKCGTLGTLGGPLTPWGGIVADVAFRDDHDEERIISLRATPITGHDRARDEADAERIWRRLQRVMWERYDGGINAPDGWSYNARMKWWNRHPTSGPEYKRACQRAELRTRKLRNELGV